MLSDAPSRGRIAGWDGGSLLPAHDFRKVDALPPVWHDVAKLIDVHAEVLLVARVHPRYKGELSGEEREDEREGRVHDGEDDGIRQHGHKKQSKPKSNEVHVRQVTASGMRGALFALAAGLSAAVQLRDIQGGSLEPLDVPNDQCGVVVSAQEDDRLTLFAVGQDGQLWHKYKLPNANMGELASGSTDGFTIWSSMGGSFLGGPSVVRDSRAKLMVFARGADRAIYMLEQQAPNSETWGHFTSLGGSMSSAPRAVLNSEARLTLTLTSSIALPARASTPPPRTTAAPPPRAGLRARLCQELRRQLAYAQVPIRQ